MANVIGPFIGVVLLFTGVAKARDLSGFSEKLQGYRILPDRSRRGVAVLVAGLELLVGAGCLIPAMARPSLVAAAVLLSGFGGFAALAIMRGSRSDCGCGLRSNEQLGWPIPLRAAFMALASLAAVASPSTAPALPAGIVGTGAALIYLSISVNWLIVRAEYSLPIRRRFR